MLLYIYNKMCNSVSFTRTAWSAEMRFNRIHGCTSAFKQEAEARSSQCAANDAGVSKNWGALI